MTNRSILEDMNSVRKTCPTVIVAVSKKQPVPWCLDSSKAQAIA